VALQFGTDGVRGAANTELTPELTLALGRAAARVLDRGRVVVGRDTRISGPLLEAALAAGFAAEGVDVEILGVVPTPAVAHVAAAEAIAGAMISASHNVYSDNGIKLFAPGGRKLPDDVEERIEAELRALLGQTPSGPSGAAVGRVGRRSQEVEDYVVHLVDALDGRRLDGLRVVLDCANGAAHRLAPLTFERLGASVTVIHAEPDGTNINDHCGATHPGDLQEAVRGGKADLGLAFDGDADRLIAVDHTGTVVDGDHIIAICALDHRARGRLRDDTVVVTVMTNLGFRLAMEQAGVHVVETAVGDRYVLEALAAGGYSLGGEQSGHVIFSDLATTGDGLLTGLVLADIVLRSGRPLAELAAEAMTRLPQVLVNVRVARRDPDIATTIADDIAAAEAGLGAVGRVLVRPSGTEPLIRVMVEAPTQHDADTTAKHLVGAVERACGAAV
jgi:phosphoglucosamine mutase